ncbi:MAG: murein biosynthesis integral membrane protein MurJ [Desulfobacteraceae bacterium]|nr:murein biosynthesis integral membrane protein MurJ [Desulfobacteraceae bacterium]MCF8093838.1 murein biosynthesis integral membrane protein MurJ [Desulfobacteraceae bacterium]
MDEKRHVTRAAGVIGAATLLSRILGFVRDMVIAWFFGAGRLSDAFFVAFRIPNLLRRLFAEGTLSMAVVPVFTEHMTRHGRDEAFALARSAVRMLSLIMAAVTLAGIAGAPWIVKIVAPGFAGSKFALTVTLTRIMFPYIICICLVALSMGILNALGHFAAPALAPVFLNLSMIGSVLFIAPHMETPVIGLAIGVLVGGLIQLALQVPFLIRKGVVIWQKAHIWHPALKKIGLLMGPAVFGAAVYQVNILVGTLLASLLPEGSVSYLYYADRLVQFPLGIFAISTSVALLPSLSRQAAARDYEALSDTFAYSMKMIFFITIPAMAGLIVLREPIVGLLFMRGAFDSESMRLTAYALFHYSLGLWAFSAVRILVSTFYALQDTKTPVKMATYSIIANIAFGIILMGPLEHGGLALATSLGSMINFCLLAAVLRKRMGGFHWKNIVVSTMKTVVSSLVMAGGLVWWHRQFPPDYAGPEMYLLANVFIAIIAGIIIYGACAAVLQRGELKFLTSMVKRN